MLSKTKYLLVILLAILMLSSCVNIEKRRYRDGYHIEWQAKKVVAQFPKVSKSKESLKELSLSIDQEQSFVLSANNESFQNNMINILKPKIVRFVLEGDTLHRKEKQHKNNGFKKNDEKNDEKMGHRKMHPLAVISLIFGVYPFAVAVWILLSSKVFMLTLGFLIFVGVVTSILGIGFSLYALFEIKKHHDQYKGVALAYVALILFLIAPLILLLLW